MLVLPLVIAVDMALKLPGDIARPSVEDAVLAELNRARTDPAALARSLRNSRAFYHGNLLARPGADAVYLTEEGLRPVDEAIAFADREDARAALAPATVLTAAAVDHQAEQSEDGSVGHAGHDGSTPGDRVRRHGGYDYVGELIAYGSTDPADIVRQLIVDDGVADRGHRRLLFDPTLRYAGVSCGDHPVYRYMCVVTVGRTPDCKPVRDGTGWRS